MTCESRTKMKRVPIKGVYLGLYDGPQATPKPSLVVQFYWGLRILRRMGNLTYLECVT